jgi:hypothetical protein
MELFGYKVIWWNSLEDKVDHDCGLIAANDRADAIRRLEEGGYSQIEEVVIHTFFELDYGILSYEDDSWKEVSDWCAKMSARETDGLE